MAIIRSRKAKVSIAVVLVLMFSIVMFISSLFWLTVHGPWEDNSPFMPRSTSVSYKGASASFQEYDAPRMKELMFELSEANVTIVFYDMDFSKHRALYLNYINFKEKALENKLVICSQIETGELVLLVLENSKLWLWKP
jgi:hypothetical protein